MAKFYYDDNNSSGIKIPIANIWTLNPRGYGSAKQAGKLLISPSIDGVVNLQSYQDTSINRYYVLLGQYVSDPLVENQDFSLGTILGYIPARESAINMNACAITVIKLVSEDGSAVRGEFYRHTALTYEFASSVSYYPSLFPPSGTSLNLNIQSGDRIVVEVGAYTNNTTSTSFTCSIYIGSNSTYFDCPSVTNISGVNTNPWIDFSTVPTFAPDSLQISINSFDKSKISTMTGQDTCTVTFQSNQNLIQWEARADGTGQGSGLLVGSGGVVTANTDVTFTVENEELTLGDKIYKINVYGKNESGVWSAYE